VVGIVPGLRLAAPRDGAGVRRALREAVQVDDGPTVVRFPKGTVGEPVEAVATEGSLDVLRDADDEDVDLLIVSVGAMAQVALGVAEKLTADGFSVRVVDPRWVLPISDDLVAAAQRAGAVAVIEDNIVGGGIGSHLTQSL